VFKKNVVSGVVVNWTPVLREGLHVDPLNIMAKFVADGTQVLEEELIDLLQKLMIGKIPCGIGLKGMI
jgi:ribulose 1,5-bisphosphate synthetase/thiazole synthase